MDWLDVFVVPADSDFDMPVVCEDGVCRIEADPASYGKIDLALGTRSRPSGDLNSHLPCEIAMLEVGAVIATRREVLAGELAAPAPKPYGYFNSYSRC